MSTETTSGRGASPVREKARGAAGAASTGHALDEDPYGSAGGAGAGGAR